MDMEIPTKSKNNSYINNMLLHNKHGVYAGLIWDLVTLPPFRIFVYQNIQHTTHTRQCQGNVINLDANVKTMAAEAEEPIEHCIMFYAFFFT